jgi:hypothetical protein
LIDKAGSITAIVHRQKKYNQNAALIVGPVSMLIAESEMTFRGDVAELPTTPGKKPHVPLARRVLTYCNVMKASSIKAFLKRLK